MHPNRHDRSFFSRNILELFPLVALPSCSRRHLSSDCVLKQDASLMCRVSDLAHYGVFSTTLFTLGTASDRFIK